jgi:hypothetical protein
MLRIANILAKPAAMNKVLSMYNRFPNKGTSVSARLLGHAWRRTLPREGLWVELNEVVDAEMDMEDGVNHLWRV